MEKFTLFPTVVAKLKVPHSVYENVDWLKKEELVGSDDLSKMTGKRSVCLDILSDPKLLKLREFILSNATKFSYELGYLEENYRIVLSWISKKDPGENHQIHTHPNSFLSGVFYFGEYEQQPGITFHSPKPTRVIEPKLRPDLSEYPLRWEYFTLGVESGDLILFLSDVQHSVPLNTSNRGRYSLAFNIMPSESLGDFDALTFFKY